MHEPWRIAPIAALAASLAVPVLAQQRPAPASPQPKEPAQKSVTWEALPRMQLEQMFAGPLKDTVIQRWRDPQTGIVCYVYLPFTVQHSPPTATGAVQYGGNAVGSIGCVESAPATAPKVASPQPQPQPPPPTAAAGRKPPSPPARAPAAGEPSGPQ